MNQKNPAADDRGMCGCKEEADVANSGPEAENACGGVNMEAAITADEVSRAGGFGARDDIGAFLPVAADSTDFEASLRYAREFEEEPLNGEKRRPGLGWIEPMDSQSQSLDGHNCRFP